MGTNKLAIGLLAGCVMAGAVSTKAIAQTPAQLDYLSEASGIPEAGLEVLQTLDMPVAIPTYMPNYMYFSQLELEFSDWGGMTYRILYEGLNEESLEVLCLTIEGTNDGIGGLPSGDRSYVVNHEMYGRDTIEEGLYGESVIPTLLGNWLGQGMGYYRFVGAGIYDGYSECNNVATDEAIAISESLRPLP